MRFENLEAIYNIIMQEVFRGKPKEDINKVKSIYLNNKELTSSIYSRDRGNHGYRVIKTNLDNYAVVNEDNAFLYKNKDVHKCKVQCIMLQLIHVE